MYNNETAVLINDVEVTDFDMLGQLKKISEHVPFLAEDKFGAFTKIRPKHILVTSNYHPNEIWPREKECQAITRRFNI